MKDPFAPVRLGNITLKNTFVRSATDEHQATPDGRPTDNAAGIYSALAGGGAGLIITGHLFCDYPLGRSSVGQSGLYTDDFIPDYEKIAQAGHKNGAAIIAQISHAGAKHRSDTEQPVSSSDVSGGAAYSPPRPLTVTQIEALCEKYVAAAVRAKRAGFDGVQIHCAHGFLLSQFIDPYFNKRTDEYGGSVENRMRLPSKIIRGVKAACGRDFPVFVKINSNTLADDAAYAAELVTMVKAFGELGVEAVELSGVEYSPRAGRLYFFERAAAVCTKTDTPIILVGGIRSSADVRKALDAGAAMVSMSRPFACQPDLVNRMAAGEWESPCVSCNMCYSKYAACGVECAVRAARKTE